ncbi:MAG: thiamine pyrophosphate-dependent dehydrogenase E1 component subunit alpha [Anaerolineae bacterium]|nr:thiamine pyrophosphate-dependent dehydrogenase E1 component subunit alpha [Anaerolineae bacterium]
MTLVKEAEKTALLSSETKVEMLRKMWLIRAFEEKAEQLYALGKVHGTMHLSIGQEASAVGAVAALRPDDYMLSTHRGHGHCLAKGADPRRTMAEFLGKVTGYCRGRGGSMHIADVGSGNLGANGVVAGGVPIAVGVGLSIQMQRMERIVLCFFGDGAAHEGAFHESLNLASLWRLPVIFLCENNQYAMSLATERGLAVSAIAQHAASYAMPGTQVDGNDVIAVFTATSAAAERARAGGGPSLIEALTYRWRGHSKSDKQLYRSREELEAWKAKDPIPRFAQSLEREDLLDTEKAGHVEAEARAAIEEAVRFAEESEEPPLAEILQGVYA